MNIWSLSDDILTCIVELLPVKDICKLDSAVCHSQLRSRYLGVLLQTIIAIPVSLKNYSKLDGSPHIKWALSRNVRMQEMTLVGGFEVLDPTDCTLLRKITTLNWLNFYPKYPFQWGDHSMWELSNITSLSFHTKRRLDLHLVIGAVAVRCPNLQILKIRCEEKVQYHSDSDHGSLRDLVSCCPHLHSLFLWNIAMAEMEDRQFLTQLNILVVYGEASTYGLHMLYTGEEYEKEFSRVLVQKKVECYTGCSLNRKAIHATWKGLSTHAMGEYIADIVPDMLILSTSDNSDCVFALPVVRQCKNIREINLRNCTHFTSDVLMLIVRLPLLNYLYLENNSSLEQILPIGAHVVCSAEEIKILNFTCLLGANLECFLKCCPHLKSACN